MSSVIIQSLYTPSSSAAGILSYLEESDNVLKVRALQKLHQVVDLHWAEVCECLPQIEELSEDSSFPACNLAAFIASKCFFHLQAYDDSLRLALCAGEYLDISAKNEYIETILAKCIDEYKTLRIEAETAGADVEPRKIDPRMEIIIEQMFQRCYNDSCFEQAVGVALDTRRLDKLRETCMHAISAGKESILGYTFNLCQGARNVTSREFRLAVIDTLVQLYGKLPEPDYTNVCFGLQYLNRPAEVAKVLEQLCRGSLEQALQAYQIAFDLQEAENQGFVLRIVAEFSALSSAISGPSSSAAGGAADSSSNSNSDSNSNSSSNSSTSDDEVFKGRVAKLKRILVDGFDIDLILNFLFKQSRTDVNILKSIKTATEGRTNVLHGATVVAHAYMNAGTTQDTFLRDNLEWLGKATNWAKFTAVASMGVVHKGHVHESMNLLQPYLPQGGQQASPYSASGALYALGLIHANKGGSGDSVTIKYLSDALRNSGTDEIVQHGACLGIGLAAMATGDSGLFESLHEKVYQDSAVGGEGAALAIGLVMVGQSDSELATNVIPNLLTTCHDTQHEKIIRALALAIAMMVYGKEESADVLIEQLSGDRDPIIRYGAMFAIAMAYCGTADNGSVRKLLHVAVSDVNDDVRRAAIMSLGFVMFRSPESVPKLVALLAESFNPHVRYGACLAVGIACAGTCLKDAIDLLTPMLEDTTDFVRQGALMSLALVLQQTSEARSPSLKKFKDHVMGIIEDKNQPTMAKSGAILAAGILDAGGRNVVVSLQSRAGFLKMGAAVGMMMFVQYWYWYPLKLMLSLSFSPTMLMGLNQDLNIPKDFELMCMAPPSMFAYPKIEEKKEDEKKLIATAVLSTTAKAKAREARKEARKLGRQNSLDSTGVPSEGPTLERTTSLMSTASYLSIEEVKQPLAEGADGGKAKKEKEPSFFTLTNPCRLVPAQVRFVTLQGSGLGHGHGHGHGHGQRYYPVRRRAAPSGIVMLIDSDPSSANDNVEKVERIALGQEEEADCPEPFEWDPLNVE